MELQAGGVEIYLVAAPPAELSGQIGEMEQDAQRQDGKSMAAPHASRHSIDAVGDGTSPTPGLDPTTAYFPPTPQVQGRSGTLGNRPPVYPELARKLGHEGKVFLSVDVDKTGLPIHVQIQKSSNHPLLDEAALAAVRQWRFRPARIGAVPVDSKVRVPICFVIEKE